MITTMVHPHARKHGLTDEDIIDAWETAIASRLRDANADPQKRIALGLLKNGNLVELVAFADTLDRWVVCHAMTPPTKNFLKELGMDRR